MAGLVAGLSALPALRGSELRGKGTQKPAQAGGAGFVQFCRAQRCSRRRSGAVATASLGGDSGLIYPPSFGDGVVLPPFPAAMARTPVEMNSSSPAAQNAQSSYTGVMPSNFVLVGVPLLRLFCEAASQESWLPVGG